LPDNLNVGRDGRVADCTGLEKGYLKTPFFPKTLEDPGKTRAFALPNDLLKLPETSQNAPFR
jgi:hypothetical protein